MSMKLLLNALIKFAIGFLMLGVLLFLPAGTLAFSGGWLLLGLLFVPMLALGAVLFFRAKDLLRKRLDSKEKESTQKGVVAMSGLIFLGGFVLAGLDFRFSLSHVPTVAVIVASVLFLVGYALYAEVMRENAYLSRTVKVEENQKVIDTGLYGIVRHPMYFATVLMFLSIPVILGSWWALLVFSVYPFVIVVRIRNEEAVLKRELAGYTEYQSKVKYRLIPLIW
ncbi:MAG: isoprenylcysteine carboxylmethyltransferase family protein [Clostridia bacterium]|nr:isoprenylcysteine carboxylmethyltransferase family protein [Clostridia bacterium]